MELGQDGRCRVPGRIPLHHHASSLRGNDTGGRRERERERERIDNSMKPASGLDCDYAEKTIGFYLLLLYICILHVHYVGTVYMYFTHKLCTLYRGCIIKNTNMYLYSLSPLSLTHTHTQYNPQLVIVSCGFDAAEGDPLGGYHVTPAGYAHMTHLLSALANGKLVVAMEGGT